MVDLLIVLAKLFASIILLSLFIAGVFKANPKTHNPKNRPIAEYMAGFICTFGALLGLYFLWIY
ncbi:hypothetical protein [Sessilibacter sp. MAH4]